MTEHQREDRLLFPTGCVQKRWFRFHWTATTNRGPEAGYYPVDQGTGSAWTERRAHDDMNAWLASHGADTFPWVDVSGGSNAPGGAS